MGNIAAGGICCGKESEDFEPFRETEGKVRMLVIALNYDYHKGAELTGISDGDNMMRIADLAQCEDVTFMRDDVENDNELFPTQENVKAKIKEIAYRCGPEDFFVFFYAGHGVNVKDRPPLDEEDGLDEAFATPGRDYQLEEKYFFVDDDFSDTLDKSFPEGVRLLVLCDCCHSATIADIDSRHWDHRILSICAAQDNEESRDTGKGGVLTIAIEAVIKELSFERGQNEYSIQTVFDKMDTKVQKMSDIQRIEMMHANADPELTPWPLARPWWKT